jgi:kynurenine formamidase
VFIVEDLIALGQLLERGFTFFAVPVKVSGKAFFPVTAFSSME